jgi:hypothetical protein
MKPKSKKLANKNKVPARKSASKAAAKKKPSKASVRKKDPLRKRKRGKRPPKPGIKAVTREYWVVRASHTPRSLLSPMTSSGKPRVSINEDEIWIEDTTGNVTVEQLPYELDAGDTICTYNPEDDPNNPGTVPEIESFEVDCYESDGGYYEDVIVYDYAEDCLSVDLSVLEEIVEEPDPATTGEAPYSCNDGTFSIGIEG